jgi:hypothetical protein
MKALTVVTLPGSKNAALFQNLQLAAIGRVFCCRTHSMANHRFRISLAWEIFERDLRISMRYCTMQHPLNDIFLVFVISVVFKAQMTRRAIGYNMCFELGPKRIF